MDFCRLIRIFNFVEDTHARKNSNTFGYLLAYSYLCPRETKYCRSRISSGGHTRPLYGECGSSGL